LLFTNEIAFILNVKILPTGHRYYIIARALGKSRENRPTASW